ncbi:IlvD/Edd family dehydratase [Paracoccus laeviglucosivorans]|uniref:Dihydroxyacid dehydratase n=1 Tax=Paracoccus laeviglucosivorans TaxID=1197861 RepID=A0A521E8L8_9RHOB|nr:IlvD/Edd family dehydratase [Paracoccus laeviglucosivorans]SMO80264.1 dihydroxyacid dehydratase [Paracoccus laeviglucosivorans]
MTKAKGLRRNVAHYGDAEFAAYLRKAFIKAMGHTDSALDRPVIGIVDTGSGFNACHRNMPDLIEAASRGVLLAGAIPVPFPIISLQESFTHPSTMYLRNLMAMDAEEMIRAQPMDAVILIGGCDKTVPALLMGAASADIPAITLVTGPMMAGSWRGERLGACTDCRRFWGRFRAGELDADEIAEVSGNLAPTIGTCGVMGTASTMALAVEAMGMMLPGGATAPAVSSERRRIAEMTGTRAVALAAEGLRPSQIMTPAAFENAFRTVMAAGGSTNAIIHLTAMAGRLGIQVDLASIDRYGRETPVLVDLKPSGQGYMEDLHNAGGLAPILREIRDSLRLDALTVTGQTLGENLDTAPAAWPQNVVRTAADPVVAGEGMVVLGGNLAPGGAILKTAAATPALLKHRGRAVVFESLADLAERLDDPDLDVTADDILVLKRAGPIGAPGMPEAGYLPIPKKLARAGVKDMVRISDARMSGTAFGTIVLHISPEAAAGGPLLAVRNGDMIALDASARSLVLEVAPEEIARRLAEAVPEPETGLRGYARLYRQSILQAEQGCDFDFCLPEMTARL